MRKRFACCCGRSGGYFAAARTVALAVVKKERRFFPLDVPRRRNRKLRASHRPAEFLRAELVAVVFVL